MEGMKVIEDKVQEECERRRLWEELIQAKEARKENENEVQEREECGQ